MEPKKGSVWLDKLNRERFLVTSFEEERLEFISLENYEGLDYQWKYCATVEKFLDQFQRPALVENDKLL